jgi:hypothetical protein
MTLMLNIRFCISLFLDLSPTKLECLLGTDNVQYGIWIPSILCIDVHLSVCLQYTTRQNYCGPVTQVLIS